MAGQKYGKIYKTPKNFTDIIMLSNGEFLTYLAFVKPNDEVMKRYEFEEKKLPVFEETFKWLDTYFGGTEPKFTPPYKIEGSTAFRDEVIKEMLKVRFGEVITYGTIASSLAKKHNMNKMSAQAVGGAVGWNPISIIIPCHRVIGSDKSITGYGGGISNKAALLKLEGYKDFKL